MPDVTVTDNREQNRYEARVDGEDAVAGFALYQDQGDSVLLPHTEVDLVA